MARRMDRWMGRLMDVRFDGWVYERIGKWMDG
jgi:hypothetical protein